MLSLYIDLCNNRNLVTDEIKKYEFKEGLPQEFEIVDLETVYREKKEILTSTHRTGFYHIIWFQTGRPTHLVDFEATTIEENSLLFLSKNTVHRFDSELTFTGKAIIFTDNFFCRSNEDSSFLRKSILFNDLFAVTQFPIARGGILFESVVDLMLEELDKPKDEYQSSILKNLLHSLLLMAERDLQGQHGADRKRGEDLEYVTKYRDLLESDFKVQRRVRFYAQQLNISEKRLNKATSRVLGLSPKAVIHQRVILEAKRRLSHTSKTVKEIAYEIGFEEATNFIKYFRKHTKVTPANFRAKYS